MVDFRNDTEKYKVGQKHLAGLNEQDMETS